MVHLRLVVPAHRVEGVLEVLEASPSVWNVVRLRDCARKPYGDVILADVAREDASVIIDDLRGLELDRFGSISLAPIETQLSAAADRAERSAGGAEGDAVIWEEVEARSSDIAELNWGFVAFMLLAALIAASGLLLDQTVLIVGAMVVGPEFGPIAGICVALVQRRPHLAAVSARALAVGFPAAIAVTWAVTLAFKATGVTPATFSEADHQFAAIVANPDFFSFFVAFCAGAAGVLSLTTTKSGALVGVLISVTTIPAAANIGVAAAYADWDASLGSALQLGVNLGAILISGTLTLAVQRALFARRRAEHARDPAPRYARIAAERSRQAERAAR
jgi:uncharacterized hydrophobic protein (TIGR00271 family)